MSLYHWLPAIVAIATVIANAAITYASVSRHEKVIEDLREAVQELRTEVAVLKATKGGGGRLDGSDGS